MAVEPSLLTPSSDRAVRNRSTRIWFVVRLVFVVSIAIFIASKIDLAALWRQVQQLNIALVMLGFGVTMLAMVIAAARWKILADGVAPGTSLISLVAFNLVGLFYSQFLPGSISGDVVKGAYLARSHHDKAGIISSALMERFIGTASNGMIGVVVLLTNTVLLHALGVTTNMVLILLVLTLIGLPVGYALFRFIGRWQHRFPAALASAYQTITVYLKQPLVIAKVVMVSVVFFVVWTLAIWCLAHAAGLDLDFQTALLILAAVNFAQVIPISLNGWGVRESALIVLLAAYGITSEKALLLSLLIAAVGMSISLLGGVLVLIDYRDKRSTISTME